MFQPSLFPPSDEHSYSFRQWVDSIAPLVSKISLDVLNPAQYSAATHPGGPVLVIAGAGTGKTRTLVHRVAWLLEQGTPPESILLLTFTRKAAQEMLDRAAQLSYQAIRVQGGTFHSAANLLLRRHGHHLGISPDFSILDQTDAEGIISLITSSLRLAGASRRFPNSRTVFDFISAAVNKNCSIDEAIERDKPHLIQFADDFYLILNHYTDFKLKHNLLDYDDLLIHLHRLLTESSAAQEVRACFSHVLVDEYQDTNALQAMIVTALSSVHRNLMVVGDDAQGIYSFRGADSQNILRFPDNRPGCAVITLEENYRSTPQILAFTNAVIANMREKFAKQLFTALPDGPKPFLFTARNEADEARWIAAKIRELIISGTPAAEIAVLFRASCHAYKLELELASAGLHYEKWGGLKLTESAHVKDVLACLRVLVNPHDRMAWHRLLLHIEQIGPKTAENILNILMAHDNPCAALRGFTSSVSQKGCFQGLLRLWEALESMRLPGLSPASVFELAICYYQPILERIHYEDHPARLRDLNRIHALAAGYSDLRTFVDDTVLSVPDNAADQGIRLIASTIHSAKGKEFNTVFVIGLAEHRFPSCGPDELNYEEERRLFYVACTRAKKRLFLTWPEMVVTPDRKHRLCEVSPFIREIDPALFDTAAV